ncbi:hypothetical protein BN439_1383 [Erwinia amylovora Ea644]|nr:hypothetical protein BN439_1383 [Erwinia amylovora Ea644]CCP06465.1 hypothetical protein BN440_1423 [Erwinia amylovora MR1]
MLPMVDILLSFASQFPGIAAPDAINQNKNDIAAKKISPGAIALLFTPFHLVLVIKGESEVYHIQYMALQQSRCFAGKMRF